MEFENKKSEVIKEQGSITPFIEAEAETIPKDGTIRIRHIKKANGKHTYHVEKYTIEDAWRQQGEHTTLDSAQAQTNALRGSEIVVNEILDY